MNGSRAEDGANGNDGMDFDPGGGVPGTVYVIAQISFKNSRCSSQAFSNNEFVRVCTIYAWHLKVTLEWPLFCPRASWCGHCRTIYGIEETVSQLFQRRLLPPVAALHRHNFTRLIKFGSENGLDGIIIS
ncbi:hypothetical protein BJX64DRAFT_268490 [Aspergillus heterothallicus]